MIKYFLNHLSLCHYQVYQLPCQKCKNSAYVQPLQISSEISPGATYCTEAKQIYLNPGLERRQEAKGALKCHLKPVKSLTVWIPRSSHLSPTGVMLNGHSLPQPGRNWKIYFQYEVLITGRAIIIDVNTVKALKNLKNMVLTLSNCLGQNQFRKKVLKAYVQCQLKLSYFERLDPYYEHNS